MHAQRCGEGAAVVPNLHAGTILTEMLRDKCEAVRHINVEWTDDEDFGPEYELEAETNDGIVLRIRVQEVIGP